MLKGEIISVNFQLITLQIEDSIHPDNSNPPLTQTVFRFLSEFELPRFYCIIKQLLGVVYLTPGRLSRRREFTRGSFS